MKKKMIFSAGVVLAAAVTFGTILIHANGMEGTRIACGGMDQKMSMGGTDGKMKHEKSGHKGMDSKGKLLINSKEALEKAEHFLENNMHGYKTGEAKLIESGMMHPAMYRVAVTLSDSSEAALYVDAESGKTAGLLAGDLDKMFSGSHKCMSDHGNGDEAKTSDNDTSADANAGHSH